MENTVKQKYLQLPDGKYLEIQEGMTNDDLNDILSSYSTVKETEKPTGWEAVAQDIKKSFTEMPAIYDVLKGVAKSGYESLRQGNAPRAAGNVLSGALEGARGLVNMPSIAGRYLASRGINTDLLPQQPIISENTGLRTKIFGEDQPGDVFPRGLGSFLPYQSIPGGQLVRFGLQAAGEGQNPIQGAILGRVLEGANKVLPEAIRNSPEVFREFPEMVKNVPNKSTKLAESLVDLVGKDNIRSSVLNVAESQAKTPIGKILPKTELTPEELRLNQEAAKGTKTPIADIIQNPILKKRFENELAIGDSKAMELMNENKRIIENRGTDLLNSLKKGISDETVADIGKSGVEAVKNSLKETKQQKNDLYKKVNEKAEKQGIKAGVNNYKDFSSNSLDLINSDKRLSEFVPESVKNILKKASEEPINNQYSLKQTNILKSKFGELAKESYTKGDEQLGGIYTGLKNAVIKDMHEAINKSADDSLLKDFREAESFYKNEYVPYKDPLIRKFTEKGGDPDLFLQTFLKTGKLTDRANLLSKVTDKISSKDKRALAYSYFINSLKENGQIDPLKWNTQYSKLGDRQKSLLFGDYLPEMEKFSRLVKMNTESLDIMRNPKTGQRSSPLIKGLGTAIGGSLGNDWTSAIAGYKIAEYAANKAANAEARLHTNEKIRNKVIDQLVKNQRKNQSIEKLKRQDAFSDVLKSLESKVKESEMEQ